MLASSLSVCNFACVVFVSSVLVSLDGVLYRLVLVMLFSSCLFVIIWIRFGLVHFGGLPTW